MKVYKRLVRDKVPDMILRDNQLPVTRTLNDKEYEEELNKKLEEEVKDYLVNKNYIDMIDIVEVIDAILDFKGIDKDSWNVTLLILFPFNSPSLLLNKSL